MGHLRLDANKPYITVISKGRKIRTLYILPKAVINLKKYVREFHSAIINPDAYLFYSRNKGILVKMSPEGVNKQLKKYAIIGEVRGILFKQIQLSKPWKGTWHAASLRFGF